VVNQGLAVDRREQRGGRLAADEIHLEPGEGSVSFGMSASGRLLVVSHTEEEDLIRIINARPATRHEQRIYEEG
jgi:uncharacterized DUF497 family protein